MNYKPDEGTLIAYLYGELEGSEKEKVEVYLANSAAARAELEKLQSVRFMMGMLGDKEVIAPPIVIDNQSNRFHWNTPFFRTVVGIAASLLVIMIVGKLTSASIRMSDHEFTISFGERPAKAVESLTDKNTLTADEVQQMIKSSLVENNQAVYENMAETQQRLDASIKDNLASNSLKINNLVQNAAMASQDQIREYVTSIQAENQKMVKDYFQLTSTEQKQYIEDLLVDFSKYLQQQRKDDLMIVQSRLNNIEQNTDIFKQETEQIITSLISNTGKTTIKN